VYQHTTIQLLVSSVSQISTSQADVSVIANYL